MTFVLELPWLRGVRASNEVHCIRIYNHLLSIFISITVDTRNSALELPLWASS